MAMDQGNDVCITAKESNGSEFCTVIFPSPYTCLSYVEGPFPAGHSSRCAWVWVLLFFHCMLNLIELLIAASFGAPSILYPE